MENEQLIEKLKTENEELRCYAEKIEKELTEQNGEMKILQETVKSLTEYKIKCEAYENVLSALSRKF